MQSFSSEYLQVGKFYHVFTNTLYFEGKVISKSDSGFELSDINIVYDAGNLNTFFKTGKSKVSEPLDGTLTFNNANITFIKEKSLS